MEKEKVEFEIRKIKNNKFSLKGYIPEMKYFLFVYNGIGTIIFLTKELEDYLDRAKPEIRKFSRFLFSHGVYTYMDENYEVKIGKRLESLYDSLNEDKYYVLIKREKCNKLVPFSKLKDLKMSEVIKEDIIKEKNRIEGKKKIK